VISDKYQIKDVQLSPENIITKSNVLIDSSYRLTTPETKLILTLFSNVQPSDQELNTYIFPISDFIELLELKGQSMYKDLRLITKGLLEKSFEIEISGEVHQVSWLSYVKYNEKKGSITIRFDSFWKPYLLQMQNNFTTYKLRNITKLRSAYSIRLYELLKQRQGLKTRTFYLKELRDKLGVPENTYPLYANFKQRILLVAQKELLTESDIAFDFKEIKHGRAVEKLVFNIHNNRTSEKVLVVPIEAKKQSGLLEELIEAGITEEDAATLLGLYPEIQIRENLEYTRTRTRAGRIKHPTAYLKRAIEQNFADTNLNDNDIVPGFMGNSTPSKTILEPKEQEKFLIQAIALMESIGNTEEEILKSTTIMMQKYYNTRSEPIECTSFSHPYIRQVCSAVMETKQKTPTR